MLAKVKTLALRGIDGFDVSAEVDIAAGLPAYAVVGLPDAAVKESKDRVIAAVRNSGFDFPSRKITVNLSPAERKKSGTHFDLPIAVGVLAASGSIEKTALKKLEDLAFIGELALDGSLRPVAGVLPMLVSLGASRAEGAAARPRSGATAVKTVIVPEGNAQEAAVSGLECLQAANLREVAEYLNGTGVLTPCSAENAPRAESSLGDFCEVKNQVFAKRALEIAAAGFHNVIMVGPPGAGKSMLARRFGGLLPELSFEEKLETTKIYSASGLVRGSRLVNERPFREPHHTISDAALTGGGSNPRPGEVSLAHNGVLFLDEFTEFSRPAIEALREPLEAWKVTVARVRETVVYPARFLLIAAMNPCPCGYLGHPAKACACTPLQVHKYRAKVSGPILDRIDLHIHLSPIKYSDWEGVPEGESSRVLAERVLKAIRIQRGRFAVSKTRANAFMGVSEVRRYCRIPEGASSVLETAMNKLGFSARSLDKILKIARTIADLEGSTDVKREHVIEAVQYRVLDRASELSGLR